MFKTRRWIASAIESADQQISLPWQRETERAVVERDMTVAVFLRAEYEPARRAA